MSQSQRWPFQHDLSHGKMAPSARAMQPSAGGHVGMGTRPFQTDPFAPPSFDPPFPHGSTASTGHAGSSPHQQALGGFQHSAGILVSGRSIATTQNINELARVLQSGAGVYGETAQAMVGWAVVNRMKRGHYNSVSDVVSTHGHQQFATNQSPTSNTLRLAEDILSGRARDISSGAEYFYTPKVMPKENDDEAHRRGSDISGGLESVPGVVDQAGKPVQNYRPYWATKYDHVSVPGLDERNFKFYRKR